MHMAFLSIHSSPLGSAGTRDTGGMSTYLRELSTAIGRAGHKVDIFTLASSREQEGVREIAHNVRLVQIAGWLGRINKNELYPHCPDIADNIDAYSRWSGSAYHVLFSHYWISGCVGRILKLRWKLPHLVMFHTLGRAKNEACINENEPQLRVDQEDIIARDADRIIVAARQEKEKILGYYDLPEEKIAVIPCGINRDLFQSSDTKKAKKKLGYGKEKIILFVGRLEPVKGLDLLIRIAALLSSKEKIRFLIVGGDCRDNTRVKQLQQRAEELGLTREVIFNGLVEHEHLPLYYNAADVTLLPSFYESFGLVPLESIACGTPVIAGPVGIVPELIFPDNPGSIGSIVTGRDPSIWAEATRMFISKPGKIAPLVIESCLKPFNWPAIANKVAAECQSLIGRRA